MTFRKKLLTFALAGAALASVVPAALAAEIRPGAGASLDLGSLAGVAHYTVEPKGYRVTVTLAPRGAAPAVRLETVLAADQGVTLSTPRLPGEPAVAVAIERRADRVFVSAPAAGPVREADATH
jgi:hypothetical protein